MKQLLEILKKEEGFRSSAYQDHLGYWTIGYGTLIDARKGGGITEKQAEYLLLSYVAAMCDEVTDALPWVHFLDHDRRTVLFAMAYQMGLRGLLSFRRTLDHVRHGRYTQAAKGMRSSKWARQTPGRAERMAKAMERGTL
jgi:lysozyme